MKSLLEIKSVWEDEYMFEVNICASNHLFSASTDCYTLRSEIKKFSELLKGFPKSLDQIVYFSTNEEKCVSCFSIEFKCKDMLGHIVARVNIVHIEDYSNMPRVEYSSEFDLELEPNDIDIFVKLLKEVSIKGVGEVTAKMKN